MRSLPVLTDDLLDTLEDLARQYDELGDEVVMTLIEPEELDQLRQAWAESPECYRSHASILKRRKRLTNDVDFDERMIARYAKRHINPLTLTRCQHLLADGHYLYRTDSDELVDLEQTMDGWIREQCRIAREMCLQRIAEELEAEDAAEEASQEKADTLKPPVSLPRRVPLSANAKNPGYKPRRAKAQRKARKAHRLATLDDAPPQRPDEPTNSN